VYRSGKSSLKRHNLFRTSCALQNRLMATLFGRYGAKARLSDHFTGPRKSQTCGWRLGGFLSTLDMLQIIIKYLWSSFLNILDLKDLSLLLPRSIITLVNC
jgi:hypothetical protein